MGLCTAAYFDERLGFPEARAIFLMSLRQIAGFDEPLAMRA